MDIDTAVISMGGEGNRIAKELLSRGVSTSKTLIPIQGKSMLAQLIDMYLALNFQKIYVLASFFEEDLARFIDFNYGGKHQIVPIYGGEAGREWGVTWHLKQLSAILPETFIYSDGNILYQSSIVRDIARSDEIAEAQAVVVVSSKDIAPTHSALSISGKNVKVVNVRVPKLSAKDSATVGDSYYSLGLMVLKKSIIETIKDFSTMKDLDIVIESLYRADKSSVLAKIYSGDWQAIHTIQDFDKLANTYKM